MVLFPLFFFPNHQPNGVVNAQAAVAAAAAASAAAATTTGGAIVNSKTALAYQVSF